MVSSSRAIIIAGLALTLCCQADASEIIETTDYHANEAKITTEGSWLALQEGDDGWKLVSIKPKFKKVDDAVLGPMKGINVSVNLPNSRILLMDGSLKPGSIVSATKGIPHKLTPAQSYENSRLPNVGEEKIYYLGKNKYVLKNVADEIILEFQGKTQVLFSYSESGETNASIVWVGDLDRDGKLDLILDASDHYNVGELRLYLSGKAQSDFGYLVSPVARRRSTGC